MIVYHASNEDITKFRPYNAESYFAQKGGTPRAIFFINEYPEPQSFLSKRKFINKYEVILDNPLFVPPYDRDATDVRMSDIVNNALEEGYDGVIFEDINDNQMICTVIVSFNPDNITRI